jgi:putative ABC transport system permease protein
MGMLIQDLRYGVRTLRRNPGFTVVAVLSLALGIGANTAIFSLTNAVLLRPLPFADPERLVMLWEDAADRGFPRNDVSPADYVDFKAQNRTMEDLAAMDRRGFNLTGDGEPEQIYSFGVTANFFPLLGIKPALGRVFATEEDRPGNEKVAMLSYGLWQSRYGGERNVIGRELLLNDEKYTIIGVLPAGFQFLQNDVRIFVPIAFTPELLNNRGRHYLIVFGRMKTGVTLSESLADMERVSHGIEQDNPGVNGTGKVGAVVLPLHEQVAGSMRRPLAMLMVAVGLVLLIACSNVANLLLARATKRQKEIAIRTALGAGRARTIAQALTESMLLAVAGALVGLIFAAWSFAFLQRMVPEGMTISTDLNLDGHILAFTLLVTLLTGLIFGLAPALQTARVNLNEILKQGGGRTNLQSGARFRSALVIAEVALSMMLLVGAALLIQTFFNLHGQYGALGGEKVLTLATPLANRKYRELPRRVEFYEQVLSRVKSLPGVAIAGYTTTVPLLLKGGTNNFTPEGRQPEPGVALDANVRQVSEDYFQTIGIVLKQGRHFAASDDANAVPVAIVNETMARQSFPDSGALGKRFKLGGTNSTAPWMTIVGIVADVRQMGMDKPAKAEMYFPYRQLTGSGYAPRDLVIRTSVEPSSLAAAVRREIHAVDPNLPISNVRTLDEILGEETATRELEMTLVTAFSALALLLSGLGIYGVLSYFVAQHTPEIGVQVALGAQSGNILGVVLKKGMLLAVTGVGIGWIAALGLTRLMQSLLFEVSATDPLTFAAVAALLIAVALLASYVPARRAMKVDPIVALRYE